MYLDVNKCAPSYQHTYRTMCMQTCLLPTIVVVHMWVYPTYICTNYMHLLIDNLTQPVTHNDIYMILQLPICIYIYACTNV